MELLLIKPRCLNINLLNGKSCLYWTNLVQQYLLKINSQQTISYLLLIKITDFLFQTAYKPEKLAPTQSAIDSAGALDVDLPPHGRARKSSYSEAWQSRQREVRCAGQPGGKRWDLSFQAVECTLAQLCLPAQPGVPRAHSLQFSLGTLNLSLSASAAALSCPGENNTAAVCQGISAVPSGLNLTHPHCSCQLHTKMFPTDCAGHKQVNSFSSGTQVSQESTQAWEQPWQMEILEWSWTKDDPTQCFQCIAQSIHVPGIWDCLNCWVPRRAAPAGLHCDDTKLPEGTEEGCAIPVSLIHINWHKMHLQQENAY